MLTESGDFDRLEKVLREDVARRDKQVAQNHPERAFVRIRLVDTLNKNARDLSDAKDILAEAKRIYDYHGDWIPAIEHETLRNLIASVEAKLNQDKGQ